MTGSGRNAADSEEDSVAIGVDAPGQQSGAALLGTLVDGDVIRDGAELTLDPDFHRAWRERMADTGDADLSHGIESAFPDFTATPTEHRDTAYYALSDRSGDGPSDRLVSHVVAVADVAAVETLADWGVTPEVARRAARPLRQFLAACPVCETDLARMNDSCCGGHGPRGPTSVLACPECSVPVYVFEDGAE